MPRISRQPTLRAARPAMIKADVVLLAALSVATVMADDRFGNAGLDESMVEKCSDLPLFALYEEAHLAGWNEEGRLELFLRADIHSADCGVPDCYGTDLLVTFKIQESDSGCVPGEVTVSKRDYRCPGEPTEVEPAAGPVRFTISDEGIDLADPNLGQVVVRSEDGSQEILFRPDNFIYYEDVKPGGVLHDSLDSEGTEESCCWGATSSELRAAANR